MNGNNNNKNDKVEVPHPVDTPSHYSALEGAANSLVDFLIRIYDENKSGLQILFAVLIIGLAINSIYIPIKES